MGVHPRGESIDPRTERIDAIPKSLVEVLDPGPESVVEGIDSSAEARSLRVDPGPQPVDPGAQVEEATDKRRCQEPDRGPRHGGHLDVTVAPGSDTTSGLNDPGPLPIHAGK